MGTLRDQLFQEFAQTGINESIAEFRRKFQVKKGDRFNYKGITYEVGPASVGVDGIEFEISSKIPQDELSKSVTLDEYFKEIKKIMTRQPKKPFSIDKENIIREMGDDEVKERDYVKLRYQFKDEELFKSKALVQQASDMDTKAVASLPAVPGVQTVAGRLVLLAVRDGLRDAANETMDHLIEANEQVRQTKLKKSKKKK
ncbi:MAG: hypothetical protein RX318_01500 [bacterium]|nr:hypothetical protein [bacterium]